MRDRVAVMNCGGIEQLGARGELYERPRTRFAAQFLGSCNLLEAVGTSRAGSPVAVQTGLRPVNVGQPAGDPPRAHHWTLGIRLEKVVLDPTGSGANCVRARIEDAIYSGAETRYLLRSREQTLEARLMNTSAGQTKWRIGDELTVQLPPEALIVLED